jgi:putative tryptophan/tyrosine transport system substrate-binding protein
MIGRRALLLASAAAFAGGAFAQPRPKRLGVLVLGPPDNTVRLLSQALGERGRRDVELIVRADGDAARLPALAAELVAMRPDAILANLTPAVRAVREATATIPIVAVAGDLLASGEAGSLARPSGNLTGVSLALAEIGGKLVELIRDAWPSVRRVAMLANSADPLTGELTESVARSAAGLGLEVRIERMRDAEAYPDAFRRMAAWPAEALILQPSLPRRPALEQAARLRLPVVSAVRGAADEGAVMTYAGDLAETYRLAATSIDRILDGDTPSALPIQQPTRYLLTVNLRALRALGLELPPSFLARADEVIE